MDSVGTISGLIALAMSALALWLTWRSDNTNRKRNDDSSKANERLSDQVGSLIEQSNSLIEQSNSLIAIVRLLIERDR